MATLQPTMHAPRLASVLWLVGAAAGLARGDVFVISNPTLQEARFTIVASRAKPQPHRLASGEQVSVPTAGAARLNLAGRDEGEYMLDANAAYFFHPLADGRLELRKIDLGGDAATADMDAAWRADHVDSVGVIPVKILADEEQRSVRRLWEERLRGRLDAASEIFQRHCRVRFEVVAVDTWDSDNELTDFEPLIREFEREVDPRPAGLAIGFTSQYKATLGRTRLGGIRFPLPTHILIREWPQHISEPERLEVLVHELGHYLGAAHSSEPDSVMRPILGDRRARLRQFPIKFDPPNTLVMYWFAEEIRDRQIARLSQLSPRTRAAAAPGLQSVGRRPSGGSRGGVPGASDHAVGGLLADRAAPRASQPAWRPRRRGKTRLASHENQTTIPGAAQGDSAVSLTESLHHMLRLIPIGLVASAGILNFTAALRAEFIEVVNEVTVESYRNYLDHGLYAHDGDNRGVGGAEHDLARNNIYDLFSSFGLTTSLDPFLYSGATYYNVVAVKTGTVRPNDIYMVGAHYDSVNNPGADDNASGVAGVLEAARVLSDEMLESTLVFIAFDREEQGLIGSTAYAQRHQGDNILGMVSLDMIAYEPDGDNAARIYYREDDSAITSELQDALARYGDINASIQQWSSNVSDHAPFDLRGKDACLLIEDNHGTNPNYHQASDSVDTLGYIDYEYATAMTRGVVGYLAEHSLASVPEPGALALVCVALIPLAVNAGCRWRRRRTSLLAAR